MNTFNICVLVLAIVLLLGSFFLTWTPEFLYYCSHGCIISIVVLTNHDLLRDKEGNAGTMSQANKDNQKLVKDNWLMIERDDLTFIHLLDNVNLNLEMVNFDYLKNLIMNLVKGTV